MSDIDKPLSEPLFKVGDLARWVMGPGNVGLAIIVDGPFFGVHRRSQESDSPIPGYAYVCKFQDKVDRIHLLGEKVLEPVPKWVPCPGKHRSVLTTWEKEEPMRIQDTED